MKYVKVVALEREEAPTGIFFVDDSATVYDVRQAMSEAANENSLADFFETVKESLRNCGFKTENVDECRGPYNIADVIRVGY